MSRILKNILKIRKYYTISPDNVIKKDIELQKTIAKQLRSKIKISGPVSVADYMREVLTHPSAGYYMKNDMIRETGDFITSPELGQLFGEMVAVWFLSEWKKIGAPKPVQIVELGPGRGSLCQDLLKVFKHFNELSSLSVSLVEVSPLLSDIQARKLCFTSESAQSSDSESLCYRKGQTASGTPINWYRKLEDVPKEFTLLVAHEFFDALPIQKFQKTDKGWREILIDVDEENENKFKYVLSSTDTVGSKLLINANESRNHIEISKDAIVVMKHLAERLEEDGGIALIADYGHNGTGTDTFRAFKQHKLHDPLLEPGLADLTADIDFSLLKSAATTNNKTICFGPVSQHDFLKEMGILARLEQLLENASPEQEKALKFAVDMMTDKTKMGERFQLMSVFPKVLESYLARFPVAGFSDRFRGPQLS